MEKKVLFISATVGIGGAGIAVERIANSLRQNGLEVDIEALNFSSNKKRLLIRRILARLNREYEKRVKFKNFGTRDPLSSTYLPFNPIGKINFFKYDVIHLHWVNYGFIGMNHIDKMVKAVPTVWTLHSLWPISAPHHYLNSGPGLQSRGLSEKTSQILDKVKVWILPSTGMRDYLPVKYLTAVVNNPLNTQETKTHFQTSSDSFVFIAAGDVFDPRKALKDLLELWISNRILLEGKKLLIVGPVSHSQLSSPLTKLAMANNVIFLGEATDTREIQTILRSSRAIFVPSMQETFGQVIAEAFASGCLVIARSSIMSLTEYEEFTEFLFKTDYSADSFAESIFWCNSREVDRDALSSAAIHHFSPNRLAQELILLYKSV